MGSPEGVRVPEPKGDGLLNGRVEVGGIDVVLVVKGAGVEDGGADAVVVEVCERKVVGEIGGWRDVGVVGEPGRNQGVEDPVDDGRGVEGAPGAGQGVKADSYVYFIEGLVEVAGGAGVLVGL